MAEGVALYLVMLALSHEEARRKRAVTVEALVQKALARDLGLAPQHEVPQSFRGQFNTKPGEEDVTRSGPAQNNTRRRHNLRSRPRPAATGAVACSAPRGVSKRRAEQRPGGQMVCGPFL